MMMTRHDLGGRPAEAEEGSLKGRSEGNHGTRLDISIQKLHWQPGRTECSPIIPTPVMLGRERPEKGFTRKEKWV